jgi:hypothetical protein
MQAIKQNGTPKKCENIIVKYNNQKHELHQIITKGIFFHLKMLYI